MRPELECPWSYSKNFRPWKTYRADSGKEKKGGGVCLQNSDILVVSPGVLVNFSCKALCHSGILSSF